MARSAATAAGVAQAVAAASAGVETAQSGCAAANRADQRGVAEQVADPQPGQAPGLGEAAHHDEAGQVAAGREGLGLAVDAGRGGGVGERLVDHEHPTGTGQRGDRARRVQDRGRVRGVADHDQVGVVRDAGRVQAEAVGRVEQDAVHPVPGGPQRRLRLGELRVHHHRAAGAGQGTGDQHEAFGGPGGEKYLLRGSPVPVSDGGAGRRRVRVRGQVAQRGGDRVGQPVRHGGTAHVDRQVDQAGRGLGVAVVAQVGLVERGGASGRWCGHVRDPAGKPPPGTAHPGVGRVTVRQFMSSSHFRIGNVIA